MKQFLNRFTKAQLVLFGAIILIIVMVMLVAVTAVRHATTSNDTASTQPAVAEPTSTEQLSVDLLDFVNRFYQQYTATPADGSSVDDQHSLALSGFGSASAINSFVNEEKQCAATAPSSVVVDGVTQINKPYEVGVTYHLADGDKQLSVNVALEGKAYLIDGISC